MDGTSAPDSFRLPAWKNAVSHVAAIAVAILFLAAGIWKMSDPFRWAQMVEELRVPFRLSRAATLALAVSETLAGILVLIPKFRKVGGWLAALLLIVFMIYIGVNYSALVGKECSCFPWVKRTVGPGFFIGDAAMLLAAFIAALWSRPIPSLRGPATVLALVAVATGASYGWAASHQSGTKAPELITADGQPLSLQHGRAFIFFYDPQCSHCDEAARHMSKYKWKDDVTVVAVPTTQKQFALPFLHDTGFKAKTSLDLDLLKKVFPFGDPPYGVVIENGRMKGPVAHYDNPEPEATLRTLGVIE